MVSLRRFISFCIYYLGSGTILMSFKSGCNMNSTNTRICFIAMRHRFSSISPYEPIRVRVGALPFKSTIFETSSNFLKAPNRFVKFWLQYEALPKNLQNYHISSVIRTDSDTNTGNTTPYITGAFRSAAFKRTGDKRRYAGSHQ